MGKNSKKNSGKSNNTTAPSNAPASAPESSEANAALSNQNTDTALTVQTIDNGDGSGATVITVPDNANTSQVAAAVAEVVKAKKVPMARVFAADGKTVLKIDGTVESVSTYVKGFMSLPVGARKGYDNYWAKEDGFTNPESIMKLTPQGIGKMVAICQHRAALYVSEGGEKGAEMTAVLEGLRQYESVAVAEAVAVAQSKLISQARETLKAAGMKPEAIDAALASMTASLAPFAAAPAPTVENDAPTLEESGDGIADADDTADAESTTVEA